jgi:hypothetical protein
MEKVRKKKNVEIVFVGEIIHKLIILFIILKMIFLKNLILKIIILFFREI